MPASPQLTAVRGSEQHWLEFLAGTAARLDEVVSGPLDDELIDELVVLRNNAEYVFVYLEANDDVVDGSAAAAWRREFANPHRVNELMRALASSSGGTAESERGRRKLLALLSAPAAAPMATSVGMALDAAAVADARLLDRLGATVADGVSSQAEYYRLLSTTVSPASREKLARAARPAAPLDGRRGARRRRGGRAAPPCGP